MDKVILSRADYVFLEFFLGQGYSLDELVLIIDDKTDSDNKTEVDD